MARKGRGMAARGWLAASVGLALSAALVIGCDSNTPDPLDVSVEDGTQGHYGGPCNPDGSCGPGLVCEHHVCKEASDGD